MRLLPYLLAGMVLAPAARAGAGDPAEARAENAADEESCTTLPSEEAHPHPDGEKGDAALDDALPSSACPRLFGTDPDRDENLDRLDELDIRAWEGRHCITLVHSGALKKPSPVHFTGLELVATTLDQDGFGVALFRLVDDVEAVDCEPGVYAVEPGDCLGEDTRVLLVLTDLVLVEHDQQLSYLVSEEGPYGPGQPPAFRMVWDSPWSMPRLQPAGSSSSSAAARRRRRNRIRRRRARARRRARRRRAR